MNMVMVMMMTHSSSPTFIVNAARKSKCGQFCEAEIVHPHSGHSHIERLFTARPHDRYGPRVENMHAADERVELASIVAGARTLARFIHAWGAAG